MKTLTTLIAAAALTASGIAVARADATLDPRSETVRFADLDISNVHGAAVLYRRIAGAAESVCRDLKPGRQLALMELYAKCVHQAIGAAVFNVGRPALTAYAAAQGARPADARIEVARNQ